MAIDIFHCIVYQLFLVACTFFFFNSVQLSVDLFISMNQITPTYRIIVFLI